MLTDTQALTHKSIITIRLWGNRPCSALPRAWDNPLTHHMGSQSLRCCEGKGYESRVREALKEDGVRDPLGGDLVIP